MNVASVFPPVIEAATAIYRFCNNIYATSAGFFKQKGRRKCQLLLNKRWCLLNRLKICLCKKKESFGGLVITIKSLVSAEILKESL
jgi:hypothetical protein